MPGFDIAMHFFFGKEAKDAVDDGIISVRSALYLGMELHHGIVQFHEHFIPFYSRPALIIGGSAVGFFLTVK